MNICTSQADKDGQAYFGVSHRRERYLTSGESSSTNVSPGHVPTHMDRATSRHIKPSFHIRSRSDQEIIQRKINVIPVTDHVPTLLQNSAPASLASSKVSATSPVPHVSSFIPPPSTPDPHPSRPSTPKPSRPAIAWNRTHSGGVWFARPLGGNRRNLQRSSDSPTSTVHFLRSGREAAGPPPKPLRPPLSRSDGSVESGHRREVTLETSFTASILAPPEPPTPPRRRLSLNPRQIFSNTVLLARRLSLRGKSAKPQTAVAESPLEHSSQNLSPIHNLTHSTALRPNKTSSVLQRVTSILSETKGQNSPQNTPAPKAVFNSSIPAPFSAGSGVQHGPGVLEASGAPMVCTPPVSYTSSQRELRLGAVPTGTPADNATYQVGDKVFFKVDISRRGGTSYLPSEARRIHTPPLPGEDVHVQGPVGPNGQRAAKAEPQEEGASGTSSARPPNLVRALSRDWYDVQLQLLESEVMLRQRHDVPLDYDIPEHLPSSPLCPRHARYWRSVQGKLPGSEEWHRACWMHGMAEH